MSIAVRRAAADELERVCAFYAAHDYAAGAAPADRIFVAERGGELIAAVRLVREHGSEVLRGMRVAGPQQRRGVGTLLLRALAAELAGQACYCLAYTHLLGFYAQAEFRPAEPAAVPTFLSERLAAYLGRRPDFVLLERPARA